MPIKYIFSKIAVCFVAAAVSASVCLAAGLAADGLLDREILHIQLLGQQDENAEFERTYVDAGAEVKIYKNYRWQTVEALQEGTVDTGKLGSYQLKYFGEYKGKKVETYRNVQVVDTKKPQIELVADPEKFTFPNETYVEEGFQATDNHDGDLTAQVERIETREKIVYKVTDSSGNTAQEERKIFYNDPVAPVLQLKGSNTVTLIQGQPYTELGAVATDNCDGDLSENIQISGSVNRYTPGIYTLTYSVSDSYNNLVKLTREVKVEPWFGENNEPPELAESNGKVIYLTFDDGPGPHTDRLLDVLKKYNVKATFFVINTDYIDTIRRAAEEGHTVGIHATEHNYKKIYASEEAYFSDLYNMQSVIRALTGQESTMLRFPGGSSNTVSRFNKGIMTRLTQAVTEKGFIYADWNVDSDDAGKTRTPDGVFWNVVNGVSKNEKAFSVVLQHDVKGYSVDAVENIIRWGLANGYTFLPMDAYTPECHHRIRN